MPKYAINKGYDDSNNDEPSDYVEMDDMDFNTEKGWFVSGVQLFLIVCLCAALVIVTGLAVGLTAPECETVAPPPPPPWENIRLPDSIVPIHYDVELQPLLPPCSRAFALHGKVSVNITAIKSTNMIVFHSDNITVDEKSIKLSSHSDDTEAPQYDRSTVDDKNTFFIIYLKNNLQAGKEYSVFMKFEGWINDKLHGFYRSKYMTPDGEEK